MHVASAGGGRTEIAGAVECEPGLRRGGEVGGAANEPGHGARDRVQDLRGGIAPADALRVRLERRQVPIPALGQLAPLDAVELVRQRRMLTPVSGEHREPPLAELPAAGAEAAAEVVRYGVGHQELRVRRPAVRLLGQTDLVLAERLAVRGARVVLVRRPPGDVAVDDDERRTVGAGLERREGLSEQVEVVGVADPHDVPSVGEEPARDVLREGEVRPPLDRDAVVVVDPAEVREAQVSGERGRLAGHALHHAAVAAERVHVVVEERVVRAVVARRQPAPCDRHPDAGRDALTEGPRRRLDAGGPVVLGMSRAFAVELAEAADVVERHGRRPERLVLGVHRLHPGQVEQRVEQHRGVPHREDEAVAVRPDRVVRVEAHVPLPERIRDRRHRHRRPRMPRVRLLHRIHREGPDGVHAERVE